jgi:small nuclear ribonucleoprotein
MTEMASKILEDSLEKVVLVRLRGGRSLRGILKGFDQHMNLVLEDAEDTTDNEKVEKIGSIIVRGDNVIIVSPSPR